MQYSFLDRRQCSRLTNNFFITMPGTQVPGILPFYGSFFILLQIRQTMPCRPPPFPGLPFAVRRKIDPLRQPCGQKQRAPEITGTRFYSYSLLTGLVCLLQIMLITLPGRSPYLPYRGRRRFPSSRFPHRFHRS